MTRYQLEPLTVDEASRWDELIAPYESGELFHRRAWLDFIAASARAEIRLWAIRSASHTAGYFCGGVIRKGPFRILGSPLKSWCTNFMGPVVNGDFDQHAFLDALDDLAARERFAIVEIENPLLSGNHLNRFGYESVEQPTYIVEITPGDLKKMWERIHKKARKAVRLAKEYGLTVEDTNDPGIAQDLYDQLIEQLARKRISPSFDRDRPRLVFNFLKPSDLLFALRVRDPSGQAIATGLFPHDDRTFYFSFASSRMSGWKFFPNDLLHWTVMEMAAARGLRVYNMCGHGRFKSKFGGVLQKPKRWHKCYWRTARWGRKGYEAFFYNRMKLKGYWNRLVFKHGGAVEAPHEND